MSQIIVFGAAFILSSFACVLVYSNQRSLKRRNRELEERLIEAETHLSRHGKLANEVAHEIKNPITAILCSAETLDLIIGPTLAEDHRKTLHYIREYGDNLLRLVSNFIDVSRAQTGNMSNNPKHVALAPVVESVMGLLSANAIKKEISMKLFCADSGLAAVVDGIHLKQIVFNLLHNAIKFTSKQGEVHIIIESDFPNPFIKISVKDNGRGISGVRLRTLFDPYGKYDAHSTGVYAAVTPGIGLGLPLCKKLVELAGGTISVESQLNVGTRFEVTLPMVIDEHASRPDLSSGTERAPEQLPQPLVGQCFLLINRVPESIGPVSDLIVAWGGKVDLVSSEMEAMRAVQGKAYDAIMLDEELIGVDFKALVNSLRGEAQRKDTTIILAGDRYFLAETGDCAGVDKVLSKPFDGRVLLDALLTSGKFQVTH